MPDAIVNPEELRRFAAALKRFTEQITSSTTSLKGSFAQLGSTWRDQEQQKFAQELQQTLQVLQRFTATANQHHDFLLRKAKVAEDYLRQR